MSARHAIRSVFVNTESRCHTHQNNKTEVRSQDLIGIATRPNFSSVGNQRQRRLTSASMLGGLACWWD